MSTSSRHRTKRERDLDRMLRRLKQREKAPLRVPDRTAPTPPVPAPEPPPTSALVSVIPEWTRVLPLPPEIPQAFSAWLFRHIQTHYAPADSHEHYLAARIALALARQHLSAARESNQPDSLWIRYETLADRQLRQGLKDWNDHRKSKPVADAMPSSSSPRPGERSAEGRLRGPNDQPASAPQATPPDPPNPQTPLNPHNTNFAAPASDTSPGAMSGGAVSGGTGSASNPCLPGEAASKAKAVSGDTASAPCPQDASPTNSPQPAQHELRRSDPSQAHPHRPIAPSTGAPASREGLANERHLLAEHAPT